MAPKLLSLLSLALLSPIAAFAQDNVFERDPRLHQSFWGIAYTPPHAANYPACGDTIEDVVRDIQLMSQLTTRMRLYGSDCGQADLVLEAINRTQVDMTVFLGIYIDGNTTTYERQRDTNLNAIQTWGARHVSGITVGNEYILEQIREDPANRDAAETLLITNMAEVRTLLAGLNLEKTIPVGTSDAGGMISLNLATGSDYVMANVHAFFAGVNYADAATWTANTLLQDQPSIVTQAPNNPTLYAAEVGWPTDAIAGGNLALNGSAAGYVESQTFLDTWVCTANQNTASGYFYFEFADGEWKREMGGSEPFWGLFDSNRQLKNLTIPDCPAPAANSCDGPCGATTASASPSSSQTGAGSVTTSTVRPSATQSGSANAASRRAEIGAALGAVVLAALGTAML